MNRRTLLKTFLAAPLLGAVGAVPSKKDVLWNENDSFGHSTCIFSAGDPAECTIYSIQPDNSVWSSTDEGLTWKKGLV